MASPESMLMKLAALLDSTSENSQEAAMNDVTTGLAAAAMARAMRVDSCMKVVYGEQSRKGRTGAKERHGSMRTEKEKGQT